MLKVCQQICDFLRSFIADNQGKHFSRKRDCICCNFEPCFNDDIIFNSMLFTSYIHWYIYTKLYRIYVDKFGIINKITQNMVVQ